MKDLTRLVKDIEALVAAELSLDEKPAVAVAFTLAPDYKRAHWVTNISRSDGITLFKGAAANMAAEAN